MEQTLRTVDAPLRESYEQLVRDYRLALGRLARRLVRDPQDAEDLLQETLLDAYRSFDRYRPGTHFYSWIARIMTNNHLDRVRRRQLATISLNGSGREDDSEPLDVPDDSADPERALMAGEFDPRLQSALATLQPSQRATVLLCDIQGVTYEEAARVERCPIGTIRSRLHRAHAALQKALSHSDSASAKRPVPSGLRSRRDFLRMTGAAAAGMTLGTLAAAGAAAPQPHRVLVWADGADTDRAGASSLADSLCTADDLLVRTALVRDRHHDLTDAALRETDVLLWVVGPNARPVSEERAAAVARRVRDEGMGLVVVGAAESTSLLKALLGQECHWETGRPEGTGSLSLKVLAPRHPVVGGIRTLSLSAAGCPEGRFLGPRPDVALLEKTDDASGRGCWQGMVWTVGKGRVFLFAPSLQSGDEVQALFLNAVRWCSGRAG